MYKKLEEETLVEMRDDTQPITLGVPILAEQATKLMDVVVEDIIRKTLKYNQVDKEVNGQKKEIISLYYDTIIVSYYFDTIIVSFYTDTIIASL